jgi:hypothetical protein
LQELALVVLTPLVVQTFGRFITINHHGCGIEVAY